MVDNYNRWLYWLHVGLCSLGHGLISNMLCLHIYRNNLEVTDDFVKEFNETTDASDRERLQCQSQKMLERIKVVFMSFYVFISVNYLPSLT